MYIASVKPILERLENERVEKENEKFIEDNKNSRNKILKSNQKESLKKQKKISKDSETKDKTEQKTKKNETNKK